MSHQKKTPAVGRGLKASLYKTSSAITQPDTSSANDLPPTEYLAEVFEVRDGRLFWRKRGIEHFAKGGRWARDGINPVQSFLNSLKRVGQPAGHKGRVRLNGATYKTAEIIALLTGGAA